LFSNDSSHNPSTASSVSPTLDPSIEIIRLSMNPTPPESTDSSVDR
jgi:hypothetical protein